jgi:hypothetical protein
MFSFPALKTSSPKLQANRSSLIKKERKKDKKKAKQNQSF